MNIAWLKRLVFLVCLLPAVVLLTRFFLDELGANPFEELTRQSGEWTLRFLLIVLAMTPLRWLTGSNRWLLLRRMLGLYAFFYAFLHLMTYLWFDQFFDWQEIITDIIKRPFITVGMVAFVMLVPLAITSTNNWIKRLGRRWKQLHKLVYYIAIAGVVHFWWLVKADTREPLIYALILSVLLGYRLWRSRSSFWLKNKQNQMVSTR